MVISFRSLSRYSLLLAGFAAFAACTNDPHALRTTTAGLNGVSRTGAFSTYAKSSQATAPVCTPELLMGFEKSEGEVVDLDHQTLPRGLYLATLSEVLLEKKIDASTEVRLLAQEVPGSRNGEILCSENMDKLLPQFDITITGLMKFDTSVHALGDQFTARQFYVFSDPSGHGVVLSNPDLGSTGQDLRRFLNSGPARGQIYRISEREYQLRLFRERDGARVRLLIRLELN